MSVGREGEQAMLPLLDAGDAGDEGLGRPSRRFQAEVLAGQTGRLWRRHDSHPGGQVLRHILFFFASTARRWCLPVHGPRVLVEPLPARTTDDVPVPPVGRPVERRPPEKVGLSTGAPWPTKARRTSVESASAAKCAKASCPHCWQRAGRQPRWKRLSSRPGFPMSAPIDTTHAPGRREPRKGEGSFPREQVVEDLLVVVFKRPRHRGGAVRCRRVDVRAMLDQETGHLNRLEQRGVEIGRDGVEVGALLDESPRDVLVVRSGCEMKEGLRAASRPRGRQRGTFRRSAVTRARSPFLTASIASSSSAASAVDAAADSTRSRNRMKLPPSTCRSPAGIAALQHPVRHQRQPVQRLQTGRGRAAEPP